MASEASILIVDDEGWNGDLLSRILARGGYTRVRAITDPRQAAALFRELRPDLVILDIHMPGLDGFGVLAQLNELVAPDDFVPVLAVTGDASIETRRRALTAGARDFLQKPFEMAEVLARVANLLTTRALHQSLQRQNQELERTVADRTEQLSRALASAEAASQAKSEFLTMMSHELRTPLNAVIGFAQQLEKNRAGRLSADELTFAQRIHENGVQLLRIIDDMLDLTQFVGGAADGRSVDRKPVDLRAVLADLVREATADPASGARKLETRIYAADNLLPLETDESKLRRLLRPILANAVKFTEAGWVRLGICSDESGRPMRIDIIDSGVGIPADRIAGIFRMFEQGETGLRRRFSGTGLGLAISCTLSELLGYRLGVVSEPGRGSGLSVLLDARTRVPDTYGELAESYEQAPARCA